MKRRGFLKGAAVIAGAPLAAQAQKATPDAPAAPAIRPPSTAERAAETSAPAEVQIIEHPGSDYMVDVIKSLPVEYIFATPGSSFRALHESIVNYGGNK